MGINWNDVYVWVIVALSIMAIGGMLTNGFEKTLPTLLTAVLTASILDIVIRKVLKKEFKFPYSAVISGLIVGSIVSFEDPLYIPLVASAIAIVSKHLLKYKAYHILNPATFGMLIGFLIFSKFDSWWAAVPFLIPFLVIIAWKIRKLHLALSFLAVFLVLTYFTNNIRLQSLSDLLSLPYYFAFIMAVEPKTTPIVRNQQIAFGVSLAVLVVLLAFVVRIPYALFVSLLSMNLLYFIYRIRK
ncbi:MAG: RnfABCDGE type electron transport complex subunit D [Candidatus Aenigmarchaeota archaeon]|nr:RnfABCDGE type electron transport complex subunit D [Candidatus Aenigmarchaeota archaeon]